MKKHLQGAYIWLIITAFVVYSFSLNTASAVFSDTIRQSFNLTSLEASLAIGSFILGFALMQVPAGYLLDRYSIKITAGTGAFLLAFGNFLLPQSSTLLAFSLANFLQGIGASFAFIAAGKLIGQWFSPKAFPILFGLMQTTSCLLTAFIHYALVEELIDKTAWQTIYHFFALFGVCVSALIFLFVRSPSDIVHQKVIPFWQCLKVVCGKKQLWVVSTAAALSFGTLAAYASFWYFSVESYFSVTPMNALVIGGYIFAGIGIGTPLWGWLSNLVKSRYKVLHLSLTLGTIFLIMVLYTPHLNINTYLPSEFMSFCTGFFLSGSMVYYTCVSESVQDNTRAVALGLINTLVFVANTALLFIPQFLVTRSSHTYLTMLWVLPVCVLVALFLNHWVKETFPKKNAR